MSIFHQHKHSTLRKNLLLGAALLSSAALVQTSAQAQSAAGSGSFYFFGDSASGQGNWSAIAGQLGEDHSPYSDNDGLQRESNGLVWVEMLGRDVDVIAQPNGASNLNFAISGAHMTRGGDLTEFGIETGVEVQVAFFADLVDQEALEIGAGDVAFMLAGANDFLDGFDAGRSAEIIQAQVVGSTVANVQALAAQGIKTILLSEVQPIEYAPEFADDAATRAELSALIDDTNGWINAAVSAADLPTDVNVVTVKYGELLRHITENASELGFSTTTTPCFIEETDELCSTDKAQQNRHLFFDDLHFTERGHQIEAQWFLATLEGANGIAAEETARMPRVAYEQLESHRTLVRPGTHSSDTHRTGLWFAPVSSSLELKAHETDPQTDLDLEGAVLGVERRVGEFAFFGGALSVGETQAKFADGSRFELLGGSVTAYAGIDMELLGRLSLAYTRGGHDVEDIERVTGVEGLSAFGETTSRHWDLEFAARSVDEGFGFTIDHGISFAVGEIRTGGYQETGARGLALGYERQTLEYQRFSIDANIAGPEWTLTDHLVLRPAAELAWIHQFGDDAYGVRSRLLDNTAMAVTTTSLAPTEDRYDAGIGVDLLMGEGWTLSGRVSRQWANDIDDASEGTIVLRRTF